MHTKPGVADQFVEDLRREVTVVMKDPGQPVEGKMAMYGMAEALPDRSLVGDITRCYIDSLYYTPKHA